MVKTYGDMVEFFAAIIIERNVKALLRKMLKVVENPLVFFGSIAYNIYITVGVSQP